MGWVLVRFLGTRVSGIHKHFQVYLQQIKKKAEAESKNCHAKTMLSLEHFPSFFFKEQNDIFLTVNAVDALKMKQNCAGALLLVVATALPSTCIALYLCTANLCCWHPATTAASSPLPICRYSAGRRMLTLRGRYIHDCMNVMDACV